MTTKLIHNAETGEIQEVELTTAEIKAAEENALRAELERKTENEKLAAKVLLLEKLGITEEEAKLLLS